MLKGIIFMKRLTNNKWATSIPNTLYLYVIIPLHFYTFKFKYQQ